MQRTKYHLIKHIFVGIVVCRTEQMNAIKITIEINNEKREPSKANEKKIVRAQRIFSMEPTRKKHTKIIQQEPKKNH